MTQSGASLLNNSQEVTISKNNWSEVINLLFLAGVLLLAALPLGWAYETQTTNVEVGTVTDLYIKRNGWGRSAKDTFFVVIQKNDGEKEILENSDSLFQWKWNSADFQQELEIGKTYIFKVYGYRVPFLSWFRNIYSFEILNK
jgi:hypothetical protein